MKVVWSVLDWFARAAAILFIALFLIPFSVFMGAFAGDSGTQAAQNTALFLICGVPVLLGLFALFIAVPDFLARRCGRGERMARVAFRIPILFVFSVVIWFFSWV